MVQRTHGPVAGQKFFHGSGTGLTPGTVQVPGDISVENVSNCLFNIIIFTSYYLYAIIPIWLYTYNM